MFIVDCVPGMDNKMKQTNMDAIQQSTLLKMVSEGILFFWEVSIVDCVSGKDNKMKQTNKDSMH